MALFKKDKKEEKPEEAVAVGGDPEPKGEPRHVAGEEFERLIGSSEVPVVVDFWAEWCGPCHAIAPSVARLAAEFNGRATVAKVDADENGAILERFGIRGIPTLIYFKGGEEVDRVTGFVPYGTLKSRLDKVLA
jgi:thioredoxin 1